MVEQPPTPTVDFDVLFFDHLIKEEPKLVNKVYSAARRKELDVKRRSSGSFKPLKEVVSEYNKLVSRKRAASDRVNRSPQAKKALRQGELLGSSDDSSDSDDNPIKRAAVRFFGDEMILLPDVSAARKKGFDLALLLMWMYSYNSCSTVKPDWHVSCLSDSESFGH
ncbi:unnamed protein product [Gongylonema pulchrum]|uniref:Uncharacterized protein n=1 Tax=Gongylonema pulchrum TaxID=637853 RepID=A0A183EQI9_9BILA|nr:unnamed protein product [Gongylonema pulchrum]